MGTSRPRAVGSGLLVGVFAVFSPVVLGGAARADAYDEIFAMLHAGAGVDSGKVTKTERDVVSGSEAVASVAYSRPDRFHMVAPDAELYAIGEMSYMGQGDSFMQMPGTFALSQIGGFANVVRVVARWKSLAELEADVGTVESLGDEEVGGVSTGHYRFRRPTPSDLAVETNDLWFGKEDGRLYRCVRNTKHNSVESEKEIVLDFEYNSVKTIEPPAG